VDDRIAIWLATHRIGFLNDFFVGLGTVDKLGLVWVIAAVAIGLTLGLGIRRTVLLALIVGLAAFAADSASFGVKDLTNRSRPFEAHPQIHPLYAVHSSSFPAGHAATAFAGAVVLAFVVPRAAPLLLSIAALIGFSRIYVGVHYPTDVLAGAVIGAVVGGICVALHRFLANWAGTSGLVLNMSE
jgi:undecaprenyl-diphosphatase